MNKIGIIGAMELEVDTLKAHMSVAGQTSRAGMVFYEGTLEQTPVVVVRCGIGKVNAAMCVQILADLFQVTHVINTGVAGSLNDALDIGDIVVSRDVIHHDMDVSALGYAPGQVPQLDTLAFPGDETLIRLALDSCEEANPGLHTAPGRIVSGDQFISDKAVKEKLIAEFHADCTEMEGAAIAHAAYLNGLPFVVIRALSDKADDSASMEYPAFERQAADHCARLVETLIKKI
ncbi:MAG: 5'-methylthioadenosine/adenosylhomocysteine nucleosidase [Acetatifactor sp.]